MDKEFIWNETRKIGIIGSEDDSNWKVVSIGHYNNYGDKVYIFDCYRKKDGTVCQKANGKMTVEEARELINLLKEV